MASTILNEQGWPADVIEWQLAHAERDKVCGAYNRAEYLDDRRRMMQAWADFLDRLHVGGKVVLLRAHNTVQFSSSSPIAFRRIVRNTAANRVGFALALS